MDFLYVWFTDKHKTSTQTSKRIQEKPAGRWFWNDAIQRLQKVLRKQRVVRSSRKSNKKMASEGRNCKHFEIHRQTVRWNFDIYRCKSTKERKRTATASIVLTSVPVKTHRQKEWTASVKKQRKLPEKVTFLYFFYTANQSKSLYNMVLQNSYYFTSKIEIKPQLDIKCNTLVRYYFTSKIEIKPQLPSSELIRSLGLFYIKDRNQTTTHAL